MEIYTLAVDLKLPEDGKIKILELMSSHHAGSAGYNMIPGHQRMQQDLIFDHLQDLAGSGYFFTSANVDTNLFKEIVDHVPRIMGKKGNVFYPLRQNDNAELAHIQRDELGFCNRHKHHLTTVNADQTFLATINDKALAALMVEDDLTGGKSYGDAFAPAVVLPTQYDKGMASRVRVALGDSKLYVIKPVEAAQGSGVRVVPARKLDAMLRKILVDLRKYEKSGMGKDYWRSDQMPMFLVEPYVASKSVAGMGNKARRKYDGTMRVFLTLHRKDAATPFAVKVHDAYWKLPRKSLSAFGRHERSVSHSPHRLEGETFGKFIRDTFNRKADTINSAAVDDADKDTVFPQVAEAAQAFVTDLLSQDLRTRITGLLNSDDNVKQSVGVALATHPDYYVSTDSEMLASDNCEFPTSFRERIKEFVADRDHPAYIMLRIFANHHQVAEPRGLGRNLKEFFDEQDERAKTDKLLSIISDMKL